MAGELKRSETTAERSSLGPDETKLAIIQTAYIRVLFEALEREDVMSLSVYICDNQATVYVVFLMYPETSEVAHLKYRTFDLSNAIGRWEFMRCLFNGMRQLEELNIEVSDEAINKVSWYFTKRNS
ncbi:MAG: hypothetical protein MUF12_03915 [Sediminibacterium sp.]|nr:hypothetical protein [Sediminibacterium sp.]